MTKKYSIVYAFVISVIIFLCMVIFVILPKKDFSEKEKRPLKPIPPLTVSALSEGSFLSDMDSYLVDHFPGRDFFISLHAGINFVMCQNEKSGIYLGKDGYLFPIPADKMQMDYSQSNLSILKKFIGDNKLYTDIIIVPYAGYVLQSKLPLNHQRYFDEELLSMVKDANIGNLINLTQRFREENRQVYYKTDHHWTTYGAYIAYCEYAKAQGFSPLPQDSFNIETILGFYGTSYAKNMLWGISPDTIELWHNMSTKLKVTIYDYDSEQIYDSLYFYDKLDTYDKYAVFLNENHGRVMIENEDADGGTLLLLKDSFANALVPFLSNHFSRIIMIDMRYFGFQSVSEVVKEYRIDKLLLVYGADTFVTDKNLLKLK